MSSDHGRAPHGLRPVQVPERHVVEAVEHGVVHQPGAAHRERALGLGLAAAVHEGMRHAHRARPRGLAAQRARHQRLGGPLVRARVVIRVRELDGGRVRIRQRAEHHRAVRVVQRERGQLRAHGPRDAQAALGHEARAEAQPLGAVVVAGDHDHRQLEVQRHAREEVVQHPHGIGRRHRAVVHVPRDEQRVGARVHQDLEELLERVLLVLEQRVLVQHLPEVPVRCVDEAHGGRSEDTFSREPRVSTRHTRSVRHNGPTG